MSDTVQHFKDHHDIQCLMEEAVEMSRDIDGAEELTTHLENMLLKEKSHISHTYTVMSGTKEAFFAQHGTKLTGTLVTLIIALVSHFFGGESHAPPPTVDVTIEMPSESQLSPSPTQ